MDDARGRRHQSITSDESPAGALYSSHVREVPSLPHEFEKQFEGVAETTEIWLSISLIGVN